MKQIGRLIGMLWAAGMLSGCLPARATLPQPPQEPKHPFPEELRSSDKRPAIQNTAFPPPEFPELPGRRSSQPSPEAPQPAKQTDAPSAGADASPALPAIAPMPPQITPPLPEKREPLAEAVQCVLENRHDEAVRHLQAYDPQTQDWFLRLLPVMSILTKKKIQDLDPSEVAVLHEQLFSLLATLRPKTELMITKACFCEWIKGYGDYKPLPDGYTFAAPSPARPGECVQLYVELRNFASELRNGHFETRFASAVEIRDGHGEKMWSHRFDDEKQIIRSRTQLHDYHTSYSFHVPKSIPPGVYTLVVQINDETNPDARRSVRKAMEFRVGATPMRAGLQ
jgi:hypothetical protein